MPGPQSLRREPNDQGESPPSYVAGVGLAYPIWSVSKDDCNVIIQFQHETVLGPIPWMAELRLHAADLNFLMGQGFTWESRSIQNPGPFYITQEWLSYLEGPLDRWQVAHHYFIGSGEHVRDPRLKWRGDLRVWARSHADLKTFAVVNQPFPKMDIVDQREPSGWTVHRHFFSIGHTMPQWWPCPSWQPGRAMSWNKWYQNLRFLATGRRWPHY